MPVPRPEQTAVCVLLALPRGCTSSALPFLFLCRPRQRHRLPPPNRKSVPRGPAGSGLHGLPEKAGIGRLPASCVWAPAAPLPPRTVWNTQHPAATRHISTEPRGGGRRLEPPNHGAACTAEPAGLLLVFVTTEVKQRLCHQASAPPAEEGTIPRPPAFGPQRKKLTCPGFFRKQRIMNELAANWLTECLPLAFHPFSDPV